MEFQIKVDDKISLKLLEKKDVSVFFDLIDKNREELRKWFSLNYADQSIEDTEKIIIEYQKEFEKGHSAVFGILYENNLIGSAGLHTIKKEHAWAEIGYWLTRDYAAKGIATICVKAIIQYGFNELRLNKIQIKCESGNGKSRSVPERLGFKLERVIKRCHEREGVFSDDFVYVLLKNEVTA